MRFEGEALYAGTIVHPIDTKPVRITTPAKTVADCFKYRKKLGISIAVEALRKGWSKRRFTMDELWAMAQREPCAQRHPSLFGIRRMKTPNAAAFVRERLLTLARRRNWEFNRLLKQLVFDNLGYIRGHFG